MPPNASKKPSLADRVMAFITPNEDIRTNVYLDASGHPTIGIGHKLTAQEKRDLKVGSVELRRLPNPPYFQVVQPLPQADIQKLLKADANEAIAAAKNLLPENPSENTLVGMADFFFQMGPNIAADPSSRKLRQALDSGHPSDLVNTMLLFTKSRDPKTGRLQISPGIVDRAEKRAALIATPDGAEGLMEMLPGADIGFSLGATGAAAFQEDLETDPSMRRAAQTLRQSPVGMPGPTQNALEGSDDFTPAAQGIIRAIQGDAAPPRQVR